MLVAGKARLVVLALMLMLYYYGVDGSALADFAVSISVPITFHECWTLTSSFSVSALLDGGIREAVGRPDSTWFGL
jgi:hypothetical protein